MFNSIFDTTAVGLEINTALIAAAVALALGLALALTHKKTAPTSKGFLITLTVLPVLVMAVMIMINGNLGTSIAILGAFSLIRFRSIAGKARDLLAVFAASTPLCAQVSLSTNLLTWEANETDTKYVTITSLGGTGRWE